MVTDPGAHRLRRHSEQALRFPCVGWMAETGIVDEASWTGGDTSKRQELPRFKHALPLPTSMESGMVFQKQESLDRPLAVPYSIKEKRPPKGGTPTMRPLIHLPHQWLITFSSGRVESDGRPSRSDAFPVTPPRRTGRADWKMSFHSVPASGSPVSSAHGRNSPSCSRYW